MHRVEAPVDSFPDDPAAVSFFAIGDFGNGGPHLAKIAGQIDRVAAGLRPKRDGVPRPFVIELGDNVYPSGLPDDRAAAEKRLREVFDEAFGSRDLVVYVIPGNHDHEGNIEHQRTTAAELFGERWSWRPARGPPESSREGPALVVWVDSERMIAQGKLDEEMAVVDVLLGAEAPWKIVAAHHPVRSHGPHGGHFEWHEHLFLREFPFVPFLGSAHVAARAAGATVEDLHSDAYQAYIARMGAVEADLLISGHEHSLQLLSGKPLQLVSGSASEHTPVEGGDDTLFAWSGCGFAYVEASATRLFIAFVDEDGRVLHTHSVTR